MVKGNSRVIGHINKKPFTAKQMDTFKKKNDGDEPVFDEDKQKGKRTTTDKVIGAAKSGFNWMARRGREIQREGTGIPAARRTPMAGLPKDPYGMGVVGNPFGGSAFPHSSHPFNGPPGPIFNDQRPPKPTPARGGTTRTIYHNNGDVEVIRTGRSKPRRVASKEPGESFMNPDFANPGYIPKSMRHLF